MLDLQKFCGHDEFRPYINQPFSWGEFTYATDGRIMVRVARLPDAPEPTTKGKWDAPFDGIDDTKFSPFHHKPLPSLGDSKDEACEECDGRGHEHDCPDCQCGCWVCKGSGKVNAQPEISTTIRGGVYDMRFVALMLSLPAVEIAESTKKDAPLMFKFDGGVGAVMPRRGKFEQHVEIEADKAA